ncbi:AP-3 complex subunit delta-1 [Pseudohyphozyma bogoriensis]|nr:AP-3 complex subunit delta-1 [Pseudohyphozyma bogoriensis]
MFEQDVAGLIKALRANKNDEQSVLRQALEETRKEIKHKDIEIKAAAVLKLVYLEMLGHSISFASFAIVECMSSTKYHIKSIGYLAASQCFDKETEVAVLVVNLVKKDLLSPPTPLFSTSPSSLTVAHLLSTLSAVSLLLTPSLARDLAPELISMLAHSRAQVRKQTMLVMWRVVKAWPGVVELSSGREERGQDPWVERLRERLADDDVGVVSATVNLICELARKDPRTYLPLAPELFGLLTASTNNWMLIKIIKLFAVLTPEEPRLVKKLVPPLTELIETTPAMSLLYECIQTSIVGGMLNGREGEALALTCVEKLKGFLEDVDQNLRYIALVALVKILPTHPNLVSIHHDTIMTCVDDPDMSIRMRALDLVEGMVDRRSLHPTVEKLMGHLRPSATTASAAAALKAQQTSTAGTPPAPAVLSTAYRTSLVALIIRMCSSSTYAHVSNFEWYLDILVELSYLSLTLPHDPSSSETSLGIKLKNQFIDVAARVKAIRPSAVRRMATLLGDETFMENGDAADVAEVLGAAAWICGEYCQELQDPRPVIASLFGSSTTTSVPSHIISLYVHNGVKVYASWLSALHENWDESDLEQVRSVTAALEGQLAACASNSDVELQERAAELGQLLELVRKGLDAPRPIAPPENGFGSSSTEPYDDDDGQGFASTSAPTRLPPSCLTLLSPMFFSHELNPVNPKAQGLVGVPEGLSLDLVIVPRTTSIKDELELDEVEEEVDDFGRPVGRPRGGEEEIVGEGRKKKGKGKAVGGKKSKRREVDEDPEEMARLKAERLERQRDDPYYVGSKSATPAEEDVDSIPIVKLDLNFGTAPAPPPPPRVPTPPPMVIDVDGELPEGMELGAGAGGGGGAPPVVETPEGETATTAKDVQATEGVVTKVVKKKKKDANGKPKKKKGEAGGTSTPTEAA